MNTRSIENYTDTTENLVEGDVFFATPKGERFIASALEKKAKGILKVDQTQLAVCAARLADHPSRKLMVIGVTGTNGKSTVTHLIAEALKKLGKNTLLIGTLSHRLTTPGSLELQKLMSDFLHNGGDAVVMEVSSHGIDQGRVYGIDFDVKILTNITHDHLDYHGSFEAYKQVKLQFMTSYSGISCYPESYQSLALSFSHQLMGEFNKQNLRAALAGLHALGFNDEQCVMALSGATPPVGRFQCVSSQDQPLVIVDYAHTPDGLNVVSDEARMLAQSRQGQLITVFGCGGNRDKTKRPAMGQVAEHYADFVVVTSDNPRFEDPQTIIDDIAKGLVTDRYCCIVDRREGIYAALRRAKPNDVVLIAGKGHELYQEIQGETISFSDASVVQSFFQERL